VTLIETTAGTVRGRRLDGGVQCFSGIPFAAPPVGSLRLRPPAPLDSWTGVRDATEFPAMPVQQSLLGEGLAGSEDCLYLNVWTPSVEGSLPVVVWFYGGGFERGSASPPYTEGARLAEHGVVVVAVNYRLGALGFLHLAELGDESWSYSTNLGLQDLVAGLRWVRANVSAFGGDAANVTVMGLSAGGFSIGALLAMPSAEGLFDKAIMQSGCTARVYPTDVATGMAQDLLKVVGASSVDELVDAPVERIIEAQVAVMETDIGRRNTPGGRAWGSVLDGRVLPVDPLDHVRSGAAAHIPMIVAATRDEVRLFEFHQATTFTPASDEVLLEEMRRCIGDRAEGLLAAYREEDPEAGLARLRSRFLSDWIYRVPATACASAQIAAGGHAWRYLFGWSPTPMGAHHGLDGFLIFDQVGMLLPQLAGDAEGAQVRSELLDGVLSFAATGDPGWPAHSPGAMTTRLFGDTEPLVVEPPELTAPYWSAYL
jgi:para-nitrobenzyl esterase